MSPELPVDLPISLPPEQWAALETAYATPTRAYHNFDHVREVLRHYGEVEAGPGWKQPAEVALAVLYHDAIYQAGRRDNEARSAELAAAHIARYLLAGFSLPQVIVDDDQVNRIFRDDA